MIITLTKVSIVLNVSMPEDNSTTSLELATRLYANIRENEIVIVIR